MATITVICREEGYASSILIYCVEVEDPRDTVAVKLAVQVERERDLGEDEANTMEILFAFDGDLYPCQDWRD